MGVVYRDLVPDNVTVDGSGYLKLWWLCVSNVGKMFNVSCSWFRQSKVLRGGERTASFCAATIAEYLAPEVILQSQGHTHAVDW